MTRITIGQYYPSNSIVHRIDPRVKLIGVFAYITALMFVNNFYGYGVAAVFVATIVALSKVPPIFIFRGLRAVVFMLIIAGLINLFLTPGENVIFSFAFLRITMEGVLMAAQMASRLTLLITGSSLLTLTTSPIQLTNAIEALLRPLKIFKVPAHDIAIMMTIVLRFIPIFGQEMEIIMKAQKARGAEFDTGGLIRRAKSMLPILIPLFVSAFRRAFELATAMEARCYRGDVNRTKLKVMKMACIDYISILVMVLFCVLIYLMR